jgi:hypothetical protein
VSHLDLSQNPCLTSIDSPNIDGTMIFTSMAAHHVPIPPSFDPTPIEIHLDADPEDIMHETLSTTVSTTLEPTTSTSVLTKMNNEGSGTFADISAQAQVPATAKDKKSFFEMQMGIDTERSVMKEEVHAQIVHEADPALSVQKAISNGNYTTSAPIKDATPEVSVAIISTDTPVTAVETASHAEESLTIESHKPELVKLEGCEATNTKSTAENTAASELEVIETATNEQTDPSTVDGSSEKHKVSCPEDLNPSTLVSEDAQKADGHDQEDKASELVSPDHDSPLANESASDTGRSDDTTAQVARLNATYDPSGESQTAMAAEPRSSLFGGPAGPKIPLPLNTIEYTGIGPVTQTGVAEEFTDLFSQDAPDAPAIPNHILQEVPGSEMDSFHFSNSGFEEFTEPEAEVGTQQEMSGQLPNPDYDSKHDAKPDITTLHDPTPSDFKYRPTSPAYSNATSNNSHTSEKSRVQDFIDLISGDLFGAFADSTETPEEFSRYEQAANVSSHNILDSTNSQPQCSCQHHCEHEVRKAFGLRPGPREEGCIYFNNIVIDTDKSGTYDDEQGKYSSAPNVDPEDLEEDEESINGGRGDHVGSGNFTTDPTGRYNNTITFNHSETRIRDRRVFDEESSSSDESQIKSKKKRKKTKTKSSKTNKKSKNNSGIATPRASDSDDEEDIKIDEQASTPAPKPPAKKKAPIVTPNQTIVQMLKRLAKPHTTKLSYPVAFNCPAVSCSICSSLSYAINGASSTPRKIKIYDFGSGNTEIPDVDEAGSPKSSAATIKPKDTQLCLACTTNYMKVLMCSNHDISPDIPPSTSSLSSQTPKTGSTPYTTAELQAICSVCTAQATYTCDNTCGARFCDTCAVKLHGDCDGSLSTMLESIPDEVGKEYPQGLRADAELLRKGGELWRFLGRMAGKRGS